MEVRAGAALPAFPELHKPLLSGDRAREHSRHGTPLLYCSTSGGPNCLEGRFSQPSIGLSCAPIHEQLNRAPSVISRALWHCTSCCPGSVKVPYLTSPSGVCLRPSTKATDTSVSAAESHLNTLGFSCVCGCCDFTAGREVSRGSETYRVVEPTACIT